MSQRGKEYVASLIKAPDLGSEIVESYLATPLFGGKRVKFEGLRVSAWSNTDIAGLELGITPYIDAVIGFEGLLARYKDVRLKRASPHQGLLGHIWRTSTPRIRDTLKDPVTKTGHLAEIALEVIDPSRLDDQPHNKALPTSDEYPTIEGTEFVLLLRARHIGKAVRRSVGRPSDEVGCLIGIQLRRDLADPGAAYLAGNTHHVSRIPDGL